MTPYLINTLLLLFLNAAAQSQMPSTEQIIREKDSLFWTAYNKCDTEGMHQFVADDVEFYHDKGGIQMGWAQMESTTKKNLCSNPDWHLRREAVAKSVRIYPMESNGTVYGAVISGDHKFYVTENSKPEYATGIAKFTHLWKLENGQWKMKRILSYDHGPIPYENKRVGISVAH